MVQHLSTSAGVPARAEMSRRSPAGNEGVVACYEIIVRSRATAVIEQPSSASSRGRCVDVVFPHNSRCLSGAPAIEISTFCHLSTIL